MLKAGKELSVVFPQMTPFTCRTQAFYREAEVLRDNYLKVSRFVEFISEKVFLNAPSRVNMLKRMYTEIPLSPKPILHSWVTWLPAVEYYVKNIEPLYNVLVALDS